MPDRSGYQRGPSHAARRSGAIGLSGCSRNRRSRAARNCTARRWPRSLPASARTRGVVLGDRVPPIGQREADSAGALTASAACLRWRRRAARGRRRRACAADSTCVRWSSKKMSARNARRNSPLSRPPRNSASSIRMFHARSVRITRSCAGALRAVTSAVRDRALVLGKIRLDPMQAGEEFLERPADSGSQRRVRFALARTRRARPPGRRARPRRRRARRRRRTRCAARRSRSCRPALGKIVAAAWPSSSARRTSPVIGRQEEVGAERRHVARRRLALGERGARDVEAVVLDRVEDAQARVGGVARQQDHLDVLLVGAIEPQQLLHQHERRPGRQDLVLVLRPGSGDRRRRPPRCRCGGSRSGRTARAR